MVLAGDCDRVAIWLNTGDGTFAAKRDYVEIDGAEGALELFVGDLNGDEALDVVVALPLGDKVSVFLNQGDGTAAAPADYATGDNPLGISGVDVDRDGDLDLAIPNWESHTLSVLLNAGDGTFTDKRDYNTLRNPIDVAATDVDGDGDMDLAVSSVDGGSKNTVQVFLNAGNGSFVLNGEYLAGRNSGAVTAADFNGDGAPDLAVNNARGELGNTVSVFLNQGRRDLC